VNVWSLELGGQFCVGAFGTNMASVAVNMFTHLIYIMKIFYNCCASNAICKENTAINYTYFNINSVYSRKSQYASTSITQNSKANKRTSLLH
jgi:hypothetical protein